MLRGPKHLLFEIFNLQSRSTETPTPESSGYVWINFGNSPWNFGHLGMIPRILWPPSLVIKQGKQVESAFNADTLNSSLLVVWIHPKLSNNLLGVWLIDSTLYQTIQPARERRLLVVATFWQTIHIQLKSQDTQLCFWTWTRMTYIPTRRKFYREHCFGKRNMTEALDFGVHHVWSNQTGLCIQKSPLINHAPQPKKIRRCPMFIHFGQTHIILFVVNTSGYIGFHESILYYLLLYHYIISY